LLDFSLTVAYYYLMSKQSLQRLLESAAIMIQGGLSETTRRCGNPGCICHRDPSRRHGPHLYLTYRSQGKSRALYIPAQHAREVRQAQAAWKKFGQLASQLAESNREQLQRKLKNTTSGRKQKTQ
jgi:hypothetical protein